MGVVMAVAGVATLLVRHAITSAQPGVAAQAEPDWWTDREQDR
ncbi:hypothetical protein ACFPFQ_07805 [Pseudonocardia sp. GCM10023141]